VGSIALRTSEIDMDFVEDIPRTEKVPYIIWNIIWVVYTVWYESMLISGFTN
jgi:hypothetical protein